MPPSSATSSPNIQADPGLVCRLEAHAIDAWPATVSERVDGGWVLRATPGLDRGRSNHALTPCRPLRPSEIPEAISRVEAFASRHGIPAGIQVSPLSKHDTLTSELDRRGWGTRWPVLVLAARIAGIEDGQPIDVSDRATPDWLAAWARCEPGPHFSNDVMLQNRPIAWKLIASLSNAD